MPSQNTLYELLGLHRDATIEEIRRAYHKAARKFHPDAQPGETELFLQVQDAYEVLSNSKRRAEYDEQLTSESIEPVVTNILYSRSYLATIEEPQLIYALIDFSAEEKCATLPNPPLNVCLVLDRSTSMQGARMDTVKSATIELVRHIKSEDVISIVAFSDRSEVLIPASRHPDRRSVESRIHMLRAGGGTEIYQGLEAGFSEINRNSSKYMINHIILLTDGRTYGDENACIQLAEKAAAQGVRLTGIGIGTEWNDVFLDEIGARTGGNSFYLSRVSDLKTFLGEQLEGLHQSFAERVELDLRTESGIALSSAFRIQPDSAILPTNPPLRLGNIPKKTMLSILLEFTVQPFSTNIDYLTLASCDLGLVLPSDPSITHKIAMKLNRMTSDRQSTESPPRRIFHALSQINLYRMQERARKEVADGQIQEASLRLQRLAKHLFSSGEQELAHTAIMEAERIQQTNMLSAEGEKRIKYGTRSFLLPSAILNGEGS